MIGRGLAATGVLATLALAACGSSPSATNTGAKATPSPSGDPNGRRGGAAAGQLVQINGSTLIVSTSNGDATVAFTGSTPVTKTRTGSVADITKGSCVTATGTKDASSVLTASTVLLSPPVNGSCTAGPFGGNGPRPSFSPRPNATARPTPSGVPQAFARGQVAAVTGTQVTLTTANGAATTITVPTTVRVAVSEAITSADLSVGDCVVAAGPKDASGTVQARSINVVPPGANGCNTGAGGFGGFGGRGFGGGGGGFFGGGGGGGGAGGGGGG
ncbi:MAG TPA: hypothetical protein VFC09_07845 [Candidatus Dormibacteraeota bacterium]|nr:hypothetical protein [Candidatus Dormibacteraeota bacterium]